jgi:predicted ATPase
MNGETGSAVARLVSRLDGMPLAIELAAARVETLGVGPLLDRLDDQFSLLAGANRLAPARHRSLAATVEWSYQLLSEEERRVFRRVSVFPGPFTLEAAEVVAGAGAGPAVLHLVDCSLIAPPRAGPDGRPRYLMLETLRAYGTSRLAEAGELPDAAAALTEHALQVARQAAAGLETRDGELAAARWLDAEDATVHQALGWALEHDPDAALRLAIALAPWWLLRGRWATGYQLLAGAAGHAGEDRPEWCTAQLSVSVGTVRSRLDRIRAKTGSRRRADLTRLALQADLVLAKPHWLRPRGSPNLRARRGRVALVPAPCLASSRQRRRRRARS